MPECCVDYQIFWHFFLLTLDVFAILMLITNTFVIYNTLSGIYCGRFWYFGTLSGISSGIPEHLRGIITRMLMEFTNNVPFTIGWQPRPPLLPPLLHLRCPWGRDVREARSVSYSTSLEKWKYYRNSCIAQTSIKSGIRKNAKETERIRTIPY